MTNPKLGDKHICKDCDTRFFDMKKSPATCPKCGLEIKPVKTTRTRRPQPVATAVTEPPVARQDPVEKDKSQADGDDNLDDLIPDSDDDSNGDELDNDDDEDELIEDVSDLGEDGDDLVEVREHMDDEVTDKN